ncbi:MAG: helix-turn-helix domain-containing protein [Kiritimatiellia bacterium]|nr:helix-turn-helix domain-containing protein [Kiritimatiellia bacterium]
MVALIDSNSHAGRTMLAWLEDHKPAGWRLIVTGLMFLNPWMTLKRLQPDGLLTCIPVSPLYLPGRKQYLPMVGVGFRKTGESCYPCVYPDPVHSARLVTDHFTDLGLQHMALLEDSCPVGESELKEAFQSAVRQSKSDFFYFSEEIRPGASARQEELRARRMVRWIQSLPKPVGILAGHCTLARRLSDVCAQFEIEIPNEVALVGADDDPLLCEIGDMPISCLRQDPEQMIRLARDLLQDAMTNGPGPFQEAGVPALSLKIRKSSGMHADHWIARRACHYIRQSALGRIRIEDVVHAVGVPRRSLERVFHEQVGRSMYAEVMRIRLEKAKDQLLSTSASVTKISESCGFVDSKQFLAHFRDKYGKTPSEWRRRSR